MTEFKFEVWPTEFRSINQYFAANPTYYGQFGLPGHEGLDIMAPMSSRIFAVAPGQVTRVRTNPSGHNYGIHVQINHIEGYQTIYAHMKEAHVRVGQTVRAGQVLGLANDTGNSFGSHLHLTLKKQNAQYKDWPHNIFDPTPFLLPLLGIVRPTGPYTEGWAFTSGITIIGELAQVASEGINLRATPSIYGRLIDLVPGGTIMILNGNARGQYTPVLVPTVSLPNTPDPDPDPPSPPPPPIDNTAVNGWGYSPYLQRNGETAVVGRYGINLRAKADRNSQNIGLVSGGSSVTIMGEQVGQYLPVRVRRQDFSGPINIPDDVVLPPDDSEPPTNTQLGWAFTSNLSISGLTVTSGRFGTNLRAQPNRNGAVVALFQEGSTGSVAGQNRGSYTPVRVDRSKLANIANPAPSVEMPDPLPGDTPPPIVEPVHDTTPGWAFKAATTVEGSTAFAGQYGINLRTAPRRNADNIGFIPANQPMIITGPEQGEYLPVRVDDDILEKPFDPNAPGASSPIRTINPPVNNPEPEPLGHAKIGLHASADPGISNKEIEEFKKMRPGMIKVLSFHDPDAVKKLSENHPNASWVIRAFLEFRSNSGIRNIGPAQFVNDTINDVRRTLDMIGPGKNVAVELHNEPNLVPEGLTGPWQDGSTFADWWLDVLNRYRQAIPNVRYIYPGLSPGSDVSGIKQDHIRFIEASRRAVEAADGLGIHTYWSNVYPMSKAIDVLDDYISRFRYKPIWITEASNNKAGTSTFRKAQQYLDFWQEIQKRPTVQGVTYFVASASNPDFAEEVWVGRGIAARVGRR
ncbi:MAG: M23 family metallopeptidase [Chloroflexota bacterium]